MGKPNRSVAGGVGVELQFCREILGDFLVRSGKYTRTLLNPKGGKGGCRDIAVGLRKISWVQEGWCCKARKGFEGSCGGFCILCCYCSIVSCTAFLFAAFSRCYWDDMRVGSHFIVICNSHLVTTVLILRSWAVRHSTERNIR